MNKAVGKSEPTVLVDQYRQAAETEATSNAYCGLRIHALSGLHDHLGRVCADHFKPAARVLDLAAGSGAMSLRLRDLGFSVEASDYVRENFRPTDIPFTEANLNENFAARFSDGSYDGIVASEIIEHLENPRHFLRECNHLLTDKGVLVLSTPNLLNAGSIASFVRNGHFLWFSDKDYKVSGHITPISLWQIRKCFEEVGLREIHTGSFGRGSSLLEGSPRLKLLASLLDTISGVPEALRGEIFVCAARRT